LGVGTDLHERHVRVPSRGELADPGDVALEVWPTRHLRGHVLLADRLGCRVERRRDWQLGVDPPAAGEPAELVHRPAHRDPLV
jgi:hypothetical protein